MTPDFKLYIQELFQPFGRVGVKRFFGGGGIYLGDTMFAMIANGDTIHLKTDETTRPDFIAEGCEQFVWTNPKSGAVWESGYYTLPAHLFDDGEELARWSAKALAVAQRAKSARPAKRAKGAAKKEKPRSLK